MSPPSNMSVMDYYDHLWSIRDKRVDGWFLMDSPWPTLTMSLLYVYSVKVLGPSFMKDRPAYQLKSSILIYNVLQVLLSAYVVYESWMAGWGTHYSWICQPVDTTPAGLPMARMVYAYYLLKLTEFLDTFFFVARKKYNQVTLLHVFHHSFMPIHSFIVVRWVPGGQETLGGLLNTFIHVIMYSYYFLAAFGPHMQKYLWWKRYLTRMQIAQFVTILVRSLIVGLGVVECGYPWQHSLFSVCLMISFLLLFINFYVHEYIIRKSGRKKGD